MPVLAHTTRGITCHAVIGSSYSHRDTGQRGGPVTTLCSPVGPATCWLASGVDDGFLCPSHSPPISQCLCSAQSLCRPSPDAGSAEG